MPAIFDTLMPMSAPPGSLVRYHSVCCVFGELMEARLLETRF